MTLGTLVKWFGGDKDRQAGGKRKKKKKDMLGLGGLLFIQQAFDSNSAILSEPGWEDEIPLGAGHPSMRSKEASEGPWGLWVTGS